MALLHTAEHLLFVEVAAKLLPNANNFLAELMKVPRIYRHHPKKTSAAKSRIHHCQLSIIHCQFVNRSAIFQK
jgi:hypothetical protein